MKLISSVSRVVTRVVTGSIFAIFVAISQAGALPLFSIGEGSTVDWAAAVANGNVVAASDPLSTGASQAFYNSQIGTDMFGTPVTNIKAATNIQVLPVSDVPDSNGQMHDSLVMSWEHDPLADDGTLSVAAWDYVYDVDPDLTGTHIKFSILPPPGVWDFSLELIDSLGRGRGWFGVPPTTNWGNFVIWSDIIGAQGPFSAFHEDAGFDITMVTTIRLNESSQFGVAFGAFPVTNPDGTPIILPGQPWNAWNHLRVVPEPTTLAIFGFGLAGLGFMRRRRELH